MSQFDSLRAYLDPGQRLSKSVSLSCALGLSLLLIAPRVVSPFQTILISYAIVYGISCIGLNLLLGYGGLLSLGHAAYFGLGAYTGAMLWNFLDVNSFELYVISGIAASMAVASVFGFLVVRATKMHFTILTLALGELIFSAFFSGAVFRLMGIHGTALYFYGDGGLYIPRLVIAGVDYSRANRMAFFTGTYYYLIVGVFVSALLVMWAIVNSNFGKALEASRDNEVRAKFVGIRVARHRWAAYVISAAFTSLGGALFGELNSAITPKHLAWYFSAFLIFAVLLGGMRTFLGPVVGAFSVVFIQDSLWWFVGHHWELWLGILLVLIALLFPTGLLGGFSTLYRKLSDRGSDQS